MNHSNLLRFSISQPPPPPPPLPLSPFHSFQENNILVNVCCPTATKKQIPPSPFHPRLIPGPYELSRLVLSSVFLSLFSCRFTFEPCHEKRDTNGIRIILRGGQSKWCMSINAWWLALSRETQSCERIPASVSLHVNIIMTSCATKSGIFPQKEIYNCKISAESFITPINIDIRSSKFQFWKKEHATRLSKKKVVSHPRFSTKFGLADGFFFIYSVCGLCKQSPLRNHQ